MVALLITCCDRAREEFLQSIGVVEGDEELERCGLNTWQGLGRGTCHRTVFPFSTDIRIWRFPESGDQRSPAIKICRENILAFAVLGEPEHSTGVQRRMCHTLVLSLGTGPNPEIIRDVGDGLGEGIVCRVNEGAGSGRAQRPHSPSAQTSGYRDSLN